MVAANCLLGESPLWCAERNCLYWVDIEAHWLWRWSAKAGASRMALGGSPGFLAKAAEGQLIVGVARSLNLIDPDRGTCRPFTMPGQAEPPVMPATVRFNDGKADRQGRIVAGGAHLEQSEPLAPAFRLDAAGAAPLADLFTVFNGPAFSPDGGRIYFTDSPSKVIRTARYEPESGRLGKIEVFASLPATSGYPDGMTVDRDGGLWNAEWDGWRLTRYHANGDLDRSIQLPVPRPTSLAFGGPDHDQLFVTSARTGLSQEDLAAAPLSGAVFRLSPGACGLPEAAADWAVPQTAWRQVNG